VSSPATSRSLSDEAKLRLSAERKMEAKELLSQSKFKNREGSVDYITLSNSLARAHNYNSDLGFGVAPADLVRRKANAINMKNGKLTEYGLSNASYAVSVDGVKPKYKASQFGISTTSDVLDNPLDSGTYEPTFGDSSGVIPPEWLDILNNEIAMKMVSNKIARVIPMSGVTMQYPYKLYSTSAINGLARTSALTGFKPTREGRPGYYDSGSLTTNEYSGYDLVLRTLDCFQTQIHSSLSLVVLNSLSGLVDVLADFQKDLADAHAYMKESIFWTSMWHFLTSGYQYSWNITGDTTDAWDSTTVEVPQGKALVLATAEHNVLALDLKSTVEYTYYAQDVADGSTSGTGIEFWDSTCDSDAKAASIRPTYISPKDQDVFDFVLDVVSEVKHKSGKCDFVVIDENVSTILAKDDRFIDTTKLSGSVKYLHEDGYLGKINVGGTASMIDVWEVNSSILIPSGATVQFAISVSGTPDTWTTADIDVMSVVYAGVYKSPGLIGVYSPISVRIDDELEIVDSKARRNNKKVLTTHDISAVSPYDVAGLTMGVIVDTTDVTYS